MRIVLDTNCFLSILPRNSRYRPIYDAYRIGIFELAVSNDILEEYQEIFARKMTETISENLIGLILKLPNTIKTDIYFRWALIQDDYDDNKFVDTAISSNTDYIVTLDKHFNCLKTIHFPSVKVINLDTFLEMIIL